jgi:hypothetical protein
MGAIPGLRCILYPYQRRALSWMLWRERRGFERVTGLGYGAMKGEVKRSSSQHGSRSNSSIPAASQRGPSSNAAHVGREAAPNGGPHSAAESGAVETAARDGVRLQKGVAAPPEQSKLPVLDAAAWPCWRRLRDPASGIIFYINPATGARIKARQ